MCLGIPGKIIKIDGKLATAEIMGAEREISVDLVEGVAVGDYVLMHAGCAIQILDEEEAKATIKLFYELKDIVNE